MIRSLVMVGRRDPVFPVLPLLAKAIILVMTLGCFSACGPDAPPRPDPEETDPEETTPPRRARFPGYPLVDDAQLRRAPRLLDHVVPRLTANPARFRNLVYEAMNVSMRHARTEQGLYEDTGEQIATRWREAAVGVRRVLALRDGLYGQQDHPIYHEPVSVMMPASWVTVAIDAVRNGRTLVAVVAPDTDDDEAWMALETPASLYGSFPGSQQLHAEATKPRTVLAPQRLSVTNARHTLQMLAQQAQTLVDAASEGPEAVAAAGAEAISESDRRYFGERLRRENIILVNIENPRVHERVDEAEGLRPPRAHVDAESVELARNAIYRRRLEDGDIGVERVDLNRMSERRHAVAMLEALIPKDDPGESQLWLFLHAGPRSNAIEDALPHVYGFRLQLEDRNINLARLRLFVRPAVPIGGGDLARRLMLAARRFRNHDLSMSLNIGTGLLGRLFDDLRPALERQEEAAER